MSLKSKQTLQKYRHLITTTYLNFMK